MTEAMQITINEWMHTLYYDRNGKTMTAPEWVDNERCGNCQFWNILPETDQPPEGWGVKGLCGSHRGMNMYRTSQCGYCGDFKYKDN